MSGTNLKKLISKKQMLVLIFFALFLYIVVPQLGGLKGNLHYIVHARASYVGAALAAIAVTYLAAAGTYCFLAFKPLQYWTTALVQIAGNFVNRLLPAGIGSLGANYIYLRHKRHTALQAGTVVAINNSLGVVGHFLVASSVLLFFRPTTATLVPSMGGNRLVLYMIVFLSVLTLAGIYAGRTRKIRSAVERFLDQLKFYQQSPHKLVLALMTSSILTISNVSALWFSASATGSHISFLNVLIIFTVGISVGTVTPSPGGLGGVEAGLIAGLVAFHVQSSQAIAIALLFRFISYWIPLVVGGVAFIVCRRAGLFNSEY